MKQFHSTIQFVFSLLLISIFISCGGDDNVEVEQPGEQELTIFFTNDMHGRLDNFSKIKHIVDTEKETTDVLLVSGGDIFSGNPIVDQYSDKGYPIIDLMNKTGYDVSVIGNHEFDYGLSILNDRLDQATFEWVCANVDASSSVLNQPDPYITLTVGDLTVTILGLVETNGKPDDVIPSTHPWRVADLMFQEHSSVIPQYEDLKEQEEADLLMALTHLGSNSDFSIANTFPWFDLIIGGHSNDLNEGTVNGIPVLMAGFNLSHLGKIELTIEDKEIVSYNVTLIPLDTYEGQDDELAAVIEAYNNTPEFSEVVGFANSYHDRTELGCFYTAALKEYMQVDVSFQNSGGIRADIDEGDITTFEIFSMDPFNNGSVVFTMTAAEVKEFFISAGRGFYVSGITMVRSDDAIIMYDENGVEIDNATTLTIGINDFIPALYENYFPFANAEVRELTTAESLVQYLKTINSTVDYEGCNNYFRY
ncbi:MAG: bifunctional UDP-sugar hydrolase/5'-nucleotidase [Cyclobacteriaceae bacterium]